MQDHAPPAMKIIGQALRRRYDPATIPTALAANGAITANTATGLLVTPLGRSSGREFSLYHRPK
jgi:hypothetical protein